MNTITPTKTLTPGELADVLESGKYLKGQSRLVEIHPTNDGQYGHCCLGVYAAECGILKSKFSNAYGASVFYVEDGDYVSTFDGEPYQRENDTELGVNAPAWMQERVAQDGDVARVSDMLMGANDSSDDFESVIVILRARQDVMDGRA